MSHGLGWVDWVKEKSFKLYIFLLDDEFHSAQTSFKMSKIIEQSNSKNKKYAGISKINFTLLFRRYFYPNQKLVGYWLTLWLLISSAANLCKKFECRAWSGSKLYYTLMVFLKEFFEKDDFEKKSAEDKKAYEITQNAKSKKTATIIW